MPFAIKSGGKVHTGAVALTPEQEAFPRSHAGFLLWDYYVGLLNHREEAVQLFIQHEAFGDEMDKRGVDHPRFGAAMGRLFATENRIIQEQIGFLTLERYADRAWRTMPTSERVSEGACDLYRVPASRENLLGLWPHVFGESIGITSGGFPLHPTALLTATAEQEREYVYTKLGNAYGDREQFIRDHGALSDG